MKNNREFIFILAIIVVGMLIFNSINTGAWSWGWSSCTPKTCSQLGKYCGSVSNGCGGTLNCGSCPLGQSCSYGKCIVKTCYPTCAPNQICSSGTCCTPTTCAGKSCGSWSNNCGGSINCGTCPTGQTCTTSGTCCTPKTCAQLGKNCGSVSNGCGGTLSCGTCASGKTCTNNVCTASTCTSGQSKCENGYIYSCSSGVWVKQSSQNCINGCDATGITCIKTCTDSDNGKAYSVKGTTTLSQTGTPRIKTDICIINSTGQILEEYYCTSPSGWDYSQSYVCPNGCSNGACL